MLFSLEHKCSIMLMCWLGMNFIPGTEGHSTKVCNYHPYVIDATGGFGTDAFILSSHGCKVRLIEKHPLVACLLEDGIRRGGRSVGASFRDNFQFQFGDSLTYLQSLNRSDQTSIPDVIYLDPMFPKSKNTALVKKNIKFLQNVLSHEPANDEALIQVALRTARKRVVVKRPAVAPCLGGLKTNIFVKSKRYRFDIYATHNHII
uniref:Ribosomal RNA small subunit methyltransferase J n=1 Tax=Cacopsylla melanoneura TaxID=428564 RepID=A0A8D9E831_9HEMI